MKAAIIAVLLLVVSLGTEAQPRIAFITPLSGTPEPSTLKAFREGMRELGYVEGKNVVITSRFAEGDTDRFPDLVAQALKEKVDVLVVGSVQGVTAAKKATSIVP